MTTSKPNYLAAVWILAWTLELIGGSLAPVWAQRRRADEPEANPQFQQQLQQKPGPAAGPISEPAGGGEPAPGGAGGGQEQGGSPPVAGGGGPAEEEAGPVSPGASGGVQIGAAPSRRALPEAPINPLETRIVVRVKNAPLSTFLDTISAQAKVNFIITEGLEDKRVTAFLQNVTVREALQILLEIKGLTYQRIGKSNTYVVSPRAKGVPNRITRIYTLSFIPLVPLQTGAADLTPVQAGAGGGGGGGGGSQAALPQAPIGGQDQGQQQQGNEKEGTIAILNIIRSVLSKQYGAIAIDSRTNSIIITDIPEVFPQVEQILAELDKKSPQVIIEAQIVEIDSDRAQNLGIEWGDSNGQLVSFRGGARDTTFPLNLPGNFSHVHFFDPVSGGAFTTIQSGLGGGGGGAGTQGGASTTGGATSGGSTSASTSQPLNNLVLQSSVVDLTSLRIVLRALVTRSEARFLGKPKILTLNNKAATIAISKATATSVNSTTTSGGGAATATTGQTVERFPTGLVLKVTPQVNREGFITMLVEPEFTDVQASDLSSLQKPVFDPIKRAASTLVRVKNGQTLVLGGLLQSKETKTVRKVPFLGYIPLIGWLFSSTSSSRNNTDLVIFLTPTVVND